MSEDNRFSFVGIEFNVPIANPVLKRAEVVLKLGIGGDSGIDPSNMRCRLHTGLGKYVVLWVWRYCRKNLI